MKSRFFIFLFLYTYTINIQAQIFQGKILIDEDPRSSYDLNTFDLNNDGKKEILLLHINGMSIYERVQDQSFSKRNIDGLSGLTGDATVFDFNKDGFLDIIHAEDSNGLSVLINDKSGNFIEEIAISDFSGIEIQDILISDINNDGESDILLTSHTEKAMYSLINLGNSEFSEKVLLPILPQSGFMDGPNDIWAYDLDSDNKIDIIVRNSSSRYSWLKNNGNGTFSEAILISQVINNPDPKFVDFDQDGDIDIFNEREVGWYENNGAGVFLDFKSVPSEITKISGFGLVEIADYNLDGNFDLALISVLGKENFQLLLNDGNFNFDENIIIEQYQSGFETLTTDLDSNGTNDLLIITGGFYTPPQLLWYPNNIPVEGTLSGCIYFDENNNGQKEANERPIENVLSRLSTNEDYYAPNNDGCYAYFVADGMYEVTFQSNPNWILSSDFSEYSIEVNGNSFQDLDFGFIPRDTFLSGIMHGVSNITRCNTDVKFDFTFQNQGTTIITEGVLWVIPDSLTNLATSVLPIDTTLADGSTGWKFENLYPGETITRSLELSIPGLGGNIEPGTKIKVFSAAEVTNTQGFTNFFKHNYEEEIRCAYDPNDKLIDPLRPEEENYTQFGDTLIYTVRFQNTGNDTAFNVVIRDTLDQELDVSTFNIINSSHRSELSTNIQDGRFVTFDFQNILLPDSTIDFNGSQGYVTYSIEANEGIPENTEIQNTASIFFDFNPPIVTNTTLNTMVSCFPIEEQFIGAVISEGETYDLPDGTAVDQAGTYTVVIEDEEDCPLEIYVVTLDVVSSVSQLPLNQSMFITPNPNSGAFILELDVKENIDLEALIIDPFGRAIKQIAIMNKYTQISEVDLPAGVYFLQLKDKEQSLLGIKKFVVLE